MRVLVLILALLGAVGSGLFGFVIYSAKQKAQKEGRLLDPEKVPHMNRAMYALFAGVPLGFVGAGLAASRRGKLAAAVLLLAYAAPFTIMVVGLKLDFAERYTRLTALPAGLAVAGLLSLFIKPGVPYKKPKPAMDISEDDDMVG